MAIYSDVNPKYSVSRNAELVVDTDAITSSIEMILSTITGERVFRPTFGSPLYAYLFKTMSEDVADDLFDQIVIALDRWEPRITLLLGRSRVTPIYDENRYEVVISYSIKDTKEIVSFTRLLRAQGEDV